MKLSFQLFFFLSFVVSTAMIAAEPCAGADGWGIYDMTACNLCATSGKGKGQCCDAIYRHSLGRNDDTYLDFNTLNFECIDLNGECTAGDATCYPGLTCVGNNAKNYFTGILTETCVLNTDDPNAHAAAKPDPNAQAAATALVTSSSSTTGTTTTSVSSFVLVAGAAAMLAMKVVRHRLHRHQYSEVKATATRIDVWWRGK